MNSLRYLSAALLGASLGLAACSADDSAGRPEPQSLFDVQIPSDFTFASSAGVQLELAPAAAVDTPVPVQVMDAEGRRMFVGAIKDRMALPLRLPVGAERSLTVVSGSGESAITQVVPLVGDRGQVTF